MREHLAAVDGQLVIDTKHAPVARAKVRLVGGPPSELLGDSPAVWTTGRDGKFTFQAGDDGVLEASHRGAREFPDRDCPATEVASAHAELSAIDEDAAQRDRSCLVDAAVGPDGP